MRPNPLRNFEVREPPAVPHSQPCEMVILEHTFSNSYGKPANASYSPPNECGEPGSWASVIFNLTTTSIGAQYDRIGMLYLNDIEVWRTSTAEPTPQGIIWTVTRDMSKYTPLLSRPGSFSLDIGNIVDQSLGLTGNFEVTLSAKFYPPTADFPAGKTADRIINMGHSSGNNMTNFLTFPQNLATAYVELFASGSGKEEFWYTNVPDEYTPKLDPNNQGNVVGKGPFREVQVWIDNLLAGVAYPFPVIYTGGILLSWWRPMPAIGAFDLPSYIVDISPFVPLLSDSRAHNFTLVVQGQGVNGSINPDWLFSASVFTSLDPSGVRTTGKILAHSTDSNTTVSVPADVSNPPEIDPTALVSFVTHSFRNLSISSTVVTGTGGSQVVSTQQNMTFINQQSWAPGHQYQSVLMRSQGSITSNHGGKTDKIDEFYYPFNMTLSSVAGASSTTIVGHLNHTYKRSQTFPLRSALGGIKVATLQESQGQLVLDANGRAVSGVGRTMQKFNYKNGMGGTYTRNVDIYNSTKTITDEESGTLAVSKPKVSSESLLSEESLGTSRLSTSTLTETATSLPPASWYKLVPARQGVISRKSGTGLHLLAAEELLGELVKAFTSPPRIYSSASRDVPACTCSLRNNSLASWYKLVPARRGVIPLRAGTGLHLLSEK
ncbi:hypothetical protein PCASD_00113 [Puccinia coronata f. sp. avenae]|uniref:Peptide N-acetyl-beta-D-glucosaminyl asparaginase amidase A N-terminal domain-containing protein n=1 Tax=Puccinia coronata f. sp. avenae TaxID=200324 RepID=A0A2N5VQT3_9BASI|nr:hypothetical protein PCASD_00113 [Puccinia coronata f. sp. avenae]